MQDRRRAGEFTVQSLPLPDSFAAAGIARRRLAAELSGWPPGVRDTALLLTSELVSNAVLHGAAPVSLSIRLSPPSSPTRLRVEVYDANPTLAPDPGEHGSDTHEHGRGLQILHALAADCGSHPAQDAPRKASWFELDSH